MNNETKVALACMLCSTSFDLEMIDGPDLKTIIKGQAAEWFVCEPNASKPFDRRAVLVDLESASNIEVAQVLSEMGFVMRPLQGAFSLDTRTWEKFIDKYDAEWRQT